MAKSRSWSVKGIDGETRDLARDAAQAAGMTIGAWIDQAILKAKQGALPDIAGSDNPTIRPTLGGESAIPQNAASASPDTSSAEPRGLPEPRTSEPSTPEILPPVETDPAPTTDNVRELVAQPQDRSGMNIETLDRPATDQQGSARPLAPPPAARRSPVRYAVLGIFLIALLAGGGWLFVEFSKTGTPPSPLVAESNVPRTNPRPEQKPQASAPAKTTAGAALPAEVRTGIEMAKAGDAKAQHDLGMLHLTGRFVEKDSAKAAEWFERAAVQGLANAQFNLGVLYERGEGIAQNDRLAFFWYQSAAEQGMARAQHNLATAYAQGKGIAKNYGKAVEWFTKSANSGLAASQFSLAAIYERGLATGEPDLGKARTWYEKAMAQGDAQATERLAALDARITAQKPSPAASAPAPAVAAPTAAKPVGRSEIREIQSLLARMNFNPGPADGQMGRNTADAIKLYQRFAGIDVDGVPTRELLEEIRLVAGSMSAR